MPGARATLTVLLLSELAFGAAGGDKGRFTITILAVVIPMSVARHRLPRAAILICTFVFLMIVIPYNEAYRNANRSGSEILSASQAISAAPGILQQTLTGQNPIKVVPNSVTYLTQRMREIDGPAIVMQRTPGQIAYSSPAQLIEEPLLDMVPRAVWPGKPVLATGYQFSQQYYELSASTYSSSAITPVGDLYRHGGWIPVIAGMFLLGCGVRVLNDVIDVRSNPHAIFLWLLLFPSLVTAEGDWATFWPASRRCCSFGCRPQVWLFSRGVRGERSRGHGDSISRAWWTGSHQAQGRLPPPFPPRCGGIQR